MYNYVYACIKERRRLPRALRIPALLSAVTAAARSVLPAHSVSLPRMRRAGHAPLLLLIGCSLLLSLPLVEGRGDARPWRRAAAAGPGLRPLRAERAGGGERR